MPGTMFNTKEVAEYLGIHEKQVYALIKNGSIPCTKVTGKWLFPRALIDEWIERDAVNNASPVLTAPEDRDYLLAAGSNDPVLDLLLGGMGQTDPDTAIYSSSVGSSMGLKMLSRKKTDIAWCHIYDPETEEYNIPRVASEFSNEEVTVVHLFYRELGFVAKRGEIAVQTFSALTGDDVVFINRQKGSGTRLFLDHMLRKEGVEAAAITGYDNEVNTHFEVGLSLVSGKANAGLATVAVANLFGLFFVPVIKEQFDMVLTKKTYFRSGVQQFIESLSSEKFRESVRYLGNYDFSESGKIIYS